MLVGESYLITCEFFHECWLSSSIHFPSFFSRYPLYIDPVYFGTRDPRPSIHNIPDDGEYNEEEEIDFANDSSAYPSDDPVPESEQSGQYLSIPTGTQSAAEEDRASVVSSTTFATPEGLTPRSSDEEAEVNPESPASNGCNGVVAVMKTERSSGSKIKAGGSQKESDSSAASNAVISIPALNVDGEAESSDMGENVGNEGAGCSSHAVPREGASPQGDRRELTVPTGDISLEVSDDGSYHFQSESQSTLTESKEGTGGRGSIGGSREGSITRGRGGGGRLVEGNGDLSVCSGGTCDVDGGSFQGNCKILSNSKARGRLSPSEAQPPPYSSSVGGSGNKPPPYSSSPRLTDRSVADRRVKAVLGHDTRPISINSSVEFPYVVSSECSAAVQTNRFLPSSVGGHSNLSGTGPSPPSSDPSSQRHLGGAGYLHGQEPLEENYSAGLGLKTGRVSSSLQAGVSPERLHGALSLVNGVNSRDHKRGVARASLDADSAPMFFMGQTDVGAEGRGARKGKGKGLWGRRGSRQPLLGLAYTKDKAVPQVFFSPNAGG